MITFEQLSTKHQNDVMKIYNYYVETTTSAFPSQPMPEAFFHVFLEMTEGKYPAYVVLDGENVAGFCMLTAYHSAQTFSKTASVTYFIDKEYTGKGIGKQCLEKLIEEAKKMGICHLISDISNENTGSINFHEKNGFRKVGEFEAIGEKLGRSFGLVLMQRDV